MEKKKGAGRVALTAVLAALALVLLYVSCMVPTGRMGLVAVAGLLPAAAVVSSGPAAGVLCYAGTGILALLLLPDKGNALLYLLFFGVYPLVKYAIERLRRLGLELVLKVAFFSLVFNVFWYLLRELFLSALPVGDWAAWLIYLVCGVAFLVYDFGFTKLISFYIQRIDKPLRKGRS